MEIVVAYSFQRTVTDLKHLVQVVESGWDDLLLFLLVERSWGAFSSYIFNFGSSDLHASTRELFSKGGCMRVRLSRWRALSGFVPGQERIDLPTRPRPIHVLLFVRQLVLSVHTNSV